MTVGVAEAPGVDLLGTHAYNDYNYYCDGADFLEGSTDTVWGKRSASDWDLQKDAEEQI